MSQIKEQGGLSGATVPSSPLEGLNTEMTKRAKAWGNEGIRTKSGTDHEMNKIDSKRVANETGSGARKNDMDYRVLKKKGGIWRTLRILGTRSEGRWKEQSNRCK